MAAASSQTLPIGYDLLGAYEVRGPIGHGVSSIVYAASVHGRRVRVEEYFPARIATRLDGVEVAPADAARQRDFDTGLAAFLTSARALAHIEHAGIVDVLHWAPANGTGYVVTEDPEGESLADRLVRAGTLSDDELRELLNPVINGLEAVHVAGQLHRQISPAAIVVRPDGSTVLRGFGPGAKVAGGARQVFEGRAASRANIAPGYAALEQYSSGGREGPWTDIYALGAVMYRSVLGTPPLDAPHRAVREDMPSASGAGGEHGKRILAGIDAALAVQIASRPQSLPAWQAMLFGAAERTPLAARAGRTSARGFGRAASASTDRVVEPVRPVRGTARATASGNGAARALRWAAPAAAAVAAIGIMTWIDAGVLRGDNADAATVFGPISEREFADPLRSGGVGPTMVRVEAGTVRVGCWTGDCLDAPVVEFDRPFALSKFEVTNADYATFAAATGRTATVGEGLAPAVSVSWDDAAAYAAWLAAETGRPYRLPREAEWEYAARAGTQGMGVPSGPDAPPPVAPPTRVGAEAANAWGFHDMPANVSEWVLDCANAPDAGPSANCEYRVRRGSSWIQPPPNAGAAWRTTSPSTFRALDTGFRVAVAR